MSVRNEKSLCPSNDPIIHLHISIFTRSTIGFVNNSWLDKNLPRAVYILWGGIFPLSRPAKSSTWHQQSAHPHRCIETCTARTTLWLLSFLLYTFVFPIYIDFFRKQQPLYCPLQGPSFEMSHCTWLPFPIQSVHIRLGLFFSFFSVSKRYGLINSEHLFAKPLRNDREWFFFMLK